MNCKKTEYLFYLIKVWDPVNDLVNNSIFLRVDADICLTPCIAGLATTLIPPLLSPPIDKLPGLKE